MASYTSSKASQTISSKADSVDFTFDISSAITSANIPAYSKITRVNITVWGDINTATNTGKMNAYFGSEQIGSETKVGGTANEKSVSEDISVSTFFNSENANAGKLKDSSVRIKVNINGPILLSKFKHTASWQITIEWRPLCTITLNANGGTCPVSSITRYSGETYGTVTSEEDKPTKAGYKFSYWATNADGTGRVYSSTVVTGNTTLYAQYTVDSYTITKEVSPSGSGEVTGAGTYEYGKSATLEAIPNAGYRFIKWNDDVTTNPRTVTVTSNATYTAYFEKIPEYTVTINVSPSEGGTTTGAGIYYEGAVVTLTATPNKGYKFLYWRYIDEDGYSIIDKSPSTKHRIKGDLTFTVYFKKLALKIKSVKIYKHSKNEIASPDNPLMSGEEAIIEVKISYE